MPFRFFQRIRIAPGLTLNLSKGGVSMSAGPRGARVTAGTSGTRATAGLPGTGLHYTVLNPHKKIRGMQRGTPQPARAALAAHAATPATSTVLPPPLGWLQRMRLPQSDKAFIEGWKAWSVGDTRQAMALLESVPASSPAGADAAWSAALLYTQQSQFDKAETLLLRALQTPSHIGQAFAQHQIRPRVQVSVTPDVQATMYPAVHSAQLLLAELQQSAGKPAQAMDTLLQLLPSEPTPQADPVVLAAYGELVTDTQDAVARQRFLRLAAPMGNDTPVHTVVMYFRAQALVQLGLHTAALDVLTPALRRKKDRSPELLRHIRLLRAQGYQALGRNALARSDFERIYAEDAAFEGVATALGLSIV